MPATTTAGEAGGVPASTGSQATPLLQVSGVSKRYGGTQALHEMSLTVARGEVRALVGANGAGKSTLVKILAGVERADAGTIHVDGAEVDIATPQAATDLGLSFIHQELNLVPKFSALQNMALGYGGAARMGFLDRKGARDRAREVMARLDPALRLDETVDRLTVSERWMVSLGRSLMRDARMIAMDEPTASFTEQEAEKLFAIVNDLTSRGVAVLYISHRLDEVLEVSHDVTVLRNGRLVGSWRKGQIDRAQLTTEIVGREVEKLVHEPTPQLATRETVLTLRGVQAPPRVRGVDLEVHRGEILGIAGLVGAGRTELARVIFGADAAAGGEMTLGGKPFSPRSPYDAIRRGVALVPEERRSQGLLLAESIAFNVAMATNEKNRRSGLPLLMPSKARAAAKDMVERFQIKAQSVSQTVGALSGGNQQKVVVAKYVQAAPKLLILDEPTVGVDVGARGELYKIIRGLAEAGAAVIVISSDFEELAICERVAVMREGVITDVVDAAHATKEHLTSLCYAVTEEDPS